ncbi:MAG: ABC transporter ATP-binding protein [Sulfolobales archaeon]
MEKILEVRNLTVHYYLPQGVVRALENVSFDLYKGEILGVAGESGSGKSTLAQAILRLVQHPGKIVSGEIIFKGTDLLRLSEREMRSIRGRKIAMIFQDPNSYLNPVHQVGMQVGEVFEAHNGGGYKKYIPKVAELFKIVKIADPIKRVYAYPHQMSGGMKQRVLISMSIAENPDLILADEPTSALDVTIQAEIVDLLRDIRDKYGSSIIFITHDLSLLLEISDRIMIMYAGRIAEIGTRDKIKNDPKHPYTKALLKSLTYERKRRLYSIPGSIPSLINPPSGCRFAPRCSEALDICSLREPPKIQISDRVVYCHLYGGDSNE